MRLRHITGGLVMIIAATCGAPAAAMASTATASTAMASTAMASTATASPIPWKPYHTKPWHDAPGKVCPFGVNVTLVRQHEQYRTLSSYPNGHPRTQEFRGPLFVRYANASTHKSVVGNLSGYGWFYYPAAGGVDAYAASHIGVTVPVGNKGFPAGEWVVTGQSLLIINRAGENSLVLIHATTENICGKLS